MKKIVIINLFLFLFTFGKGYSQALYTGGEGGGYASVSISLNTGAEHLLQVAESFNVCVFPNPVSTDCQVSAISSEFKAGQIVTFYIYDLLGNTIISKDISLTSSSTALDLPKNRMGKGFYLFVFAMGKKQSAVKVFFV